VNPLPDVPDPVITEEESGEGEGVVDERLDVSGLMNAADRTLPRQWTG
jgi:hypothetical protein